MNRSLRLAAAASIVVSSSAFSEQHPASLKERITCDARLGKVKASAISLLRSGFTAGDGYAEVWIRDFNTFVDLACATHAKEIIRKQLLLFFHFQGKDGSVVDGLSPANKRGVDYKYIESPSQPDLVAHKNTVETDQETSLVQAVCRYALLTGDRSIFTENVNGRSVLDRLDAALSFLMEHRFDKATGLIWGATTADWGDVQPEHVWGVELDDASHLAVDIYDNAMFVIALNDLLKTGLLREERQDHWQVVKSSLEANIRKNLWDEDAQKFIPHVYLKSSPFPPDFDERAIYFHGGTAVAIEAGLLSLEEVRRSLEKMRANVRAAGAATIGLTLYPPYPEGMFKNPSMAKPYSYQNGGDWAWFGGRMVQQLIRLGLVEEALDALSPMLDQVIANNGFYEWYSRDNKPQGSGSYRGAAGVLYRAIVMLEEWAAASDK